MGRRSAWRGYALALAAAGLWALSATLAKTLFTATLNPVSLAQARSLVGFATLWVLLWTVRRPLVRLARRDVGLAAALGGVMAVMHATYYTAISRMPVAVAILIQYLAPLLILLYVRCFRRRRLGRSVWAAAFFCLAGCALVSGVGGLGGPVDGVGVGAALLSAVTYAAYILLMEAGVRRTSPWTLVCYGLGFAAAWWNFFRPWWLFPVDAVTPGTAGLVLFISAFGTFVPFGLVGLATQYIPAGHAGIATTAEPVIAAAWAFLLLGERLSPVQALGGCLVLAGIVTVQRFGAPPVEARTGADVSLAASRTPPAMRNVRDSECGGHGDGFP